MLETLFKNCNRELSPLVRDTLTLTLGAISVAAPAEGTGAFAGGSPDTASNDPGALSTLLRRTPDEAAALSIWEISKNTFLSDGNSCSTATTCFSSSVLSRLTRITDFCLRLSAFCTSSVLDLLICSARENLGHTIIKRTAKETKIDTAGTAKDEYLAISKLFSALIVALVTADKSIN